MGALRKEQDIFEAAYYATISDPQWFCVNVLNFKALPWQLTAINAVLDVQRIILGLPTITNHEGKQRISIRSCHGTGKTQFIALLMHIWNFVNYGKIACTAPKEQQLTKRLMPRYRKILRSAAPEYRKRIKVIAKEIIIERDEDWGANMETASDPDNLAGYHDDPQLFLVDEASAKRLDPMFPVIEGALTTPGSVLVEIGNPTRTEGEFFQHHNKKGIKELYYLMHIKASDAPDLIDQKWLDNMAIKYGVNSPIYLIRAAGEFASFDEYILLPLEYIEEAMDIEEASDGSLSKLRVSVDVADGGQDNTVITVARHYASFIQILKQKTFNFPTAQSPILAAKAAKRLFDAFDGNIEDGSDFVVDSLGVGSGCAGRLIEMGMPVVVSKGGESSVNPKKWRNRRVQEYIALYEFFMDGKIRITPGAIDDEDEFASHLMSIKRDNGGDKVDDIETKKKLMIHSPSPDRADSLRMQMSGIVATFIRTPSSGIEIMGESFQDTYDAGMAI